MPSGTHYCSQISIAGAYEAFEGGDDDTITTSADRDRHQLDREKREGEKDIEEKKNKSTGSEKTDRQIERASAPRAPRKHSYLYDGAPAERNIINMASATEAMDISKTTPVPHNTVTFSAPVEGLVKFHADVSVKARNEFIPSLWVNTVSWRMRAYNG